MRWLCRKQVTTEGSRGLGKVVEDATKYGLRIHRYKIQQFLALFTCIASYHLVTHFSVKFSGQPEFGVNDGLESLKR